MPIKSNSGTLPGEKENVGHCIDYLTSLEKLTVDYKSSTLVKSPFKWDMIEQPSFLRLRELDLRIEPLNYRNPCASVEDEEAVLRHFRALALTTTPKTLRIRGIALSGGVVTALHQVRSNENSAS